MSRMAESFIKVRFSSTVQRHLYCGQFAGQRGYWHVLERDGSSFRGHFGGQLLTTDDTWFRPVDCTVGPDGAVYVADWYDKRATHVDSLDTWDRSNGRIYKIEQSVSARGARATAAARPQFRSTFQSCRAKHWSNCSLIRTTGFVGGPPISCETTRRESCPRPAPECFDSKG